MDIPIDWKEVKVNDKFVFWIPADLTAVDVLSLDSQVQRWESRDIVVHFDYGRFSDPLTFYSKKKSYRKVTELISGYNATIVSFEREDGWRFAAVHFSDLGRDAFGQVIKLTLVVETSPEVDEETPLIIVKSVKL